MVERNLNSELFLQLVFSVDEGSSEQSILKKSTPLYLRKLNCYAVTFRKTDMCRVVKILISGEMQVVT